MRPVRNRKSHLLEMTGLATHPSIPEAAARWAVAMFSSVLLRPKAADEIPGKHCIPALQQRRSQ